MELMIQENDSSLIPLLYTSDTNDSSDIINSHNFDSMIGLHEAIEQVGMRTSEEIQQYSYIKSVVISNPKQNLIEEDQVYQEKEILVSAMKHHSVLHKFQFHVIQSNAKRLGGQGKRP